MADAVALVEQAQFGRALTRLECEAVCPPTEATLAALRALHPPSSADRFPMPPPPLGAAAPPVLDIPWEVFEEAMTRRRPRGSAPGMSGMRFEHLWAVYCHATAECLTFITLVTSNGAASLLRADSPVSSKESRSFALSQRDDCHA